MVAEIQSPVAGSSLCCEGSPPFLAPQERKEIKMFSLTTVESLHNYKSSTLFTCRVFPLPLSSVKSKAAPFNK